MNSQLPAHLQGPSRGLAKQLHQNLGTGAPAYLSIAGGRFTWVDSAGNARPVETFDPKAGVYVDLCIVDVNEHTSKIYYEAAYDPSDPQPPLCFSNNGVAPSVQAGYPQSPTCASCPKNVWGSKISQKGSKVKACADYQFIGVVPVPLNEMAFLLRVPPDSRVNFRAYIEQFSNQAFDIDAVVTRVTFQPGEIGKLVFTPTAFIDEPTALFRNKLIAAKATDSLVGRNDVPRTEALANPVTQVSHIAAPGAVSTQQGPFAAQPAPAAQQPTAPQAALPATGTVATAPRGRGRPPKTATPAGTPAPFAPQPMEQLKPNGPAFGIGQGTVEPNPEITSTLNSLFGKQG